MAKFAIVAEVLAQGRAQPMPDTFTAQRSLTGNRHDLRFEQGDSHAALEVPEEKQEEITGYVHSYETAGTLDGPGIRFVGFLTGCHFRCQYCHNPDTWHVKDGRHIASSKVMWRPSFTCQVSGLWQYWQRKWHPVRKPTNRMPGPSSVPAVS